MNLLDEATSIQLADDYNSDISCVRLLAFPAPIFDAGSFIMGDCPSGRRYFARVIGPQRNLNRAGLTALDPTSINQLEKVQLGEYTRDVVVEECWYYEAQLLQQIEGGDVGSVLVRPLIGTTWRAATVDQAQQFLHLPGGHAAHRIGELSAGGIPLEIDARTLRHHVLVAGAIGSGKSNVIAKAIFAALDLGLFVIIYDHKPDYQHIDQCNDELLDHAAGRAIDRVSFWGLGKSGRIRRDERMISVPAHDLDRSMLCQSIFYWDNEHLQAECMETLLLYYINNCNGKNWTLAEFVKALPAQIADVPKKFGGYQPNESSYFTMLRKLGSPGRIPSFIDAALPGPESGELSVRRRADPSFRLGDLARPGEAMVVRVSAESSGRVYGLFLSYLLEQASRMRANDKGSPGVVHKVDEAQVIFSGGDHFKGAFGGALERQMRLGRSRNISFVLGVQAAGAVPPQIRQHCNSAIIMRHNNLDQLRHASERLCDEDRAAVLTFTPGEALVDLFGASGLVHCRMDRSPCMLTKESWS
jgi:hypothetical protein